MTNRELIEHLSTLPPNLQVVINDADSELLLADIAISLTKETATHPPLIELWASYDGNIVY